MQVPVNDPLMLIPAMALVTEHLGFGVTCALSYEQPYPFARRMSTLDHLTNGRIGWNIVTGYLDSAARGMGLAAQVAPRRPLRRRRGIHAGGLQAVGGELGGRRGAARPRRAGASPTPTRSTASATRGRTSSVDAIHLCEPSPQRTPVLFQAGASTRGRDFAARHAECVFINGPSKKVVGGIVADMRRRAAAAGRDPATC